MKLLSIAFVASMILWGTATAQPNEAGEEIWIPAKEMVSDGKVEDIRLEATLYLPKGKGPHPVLIFNHGYTGGAFHRIRYDEFSEDLVARGVAVIIPMRRGLANSGGTRNEPRTCDTRENNLAVNHSIDDIDAVFSYVKGHPSFDATRMLIGGQSRGGILSLLYAARRGGQQFNGVINFVGTWNDDRSCRFDDINQLLFKEAGQLLRTPTLWLYGEGDSYNSNKSISEYAEIYRQAGGDISFHLYAHDFWNGHSLLTKGAKYWSPDLDQFLDKVGLPRRQ